MMVSKAFRANDQSSETATDRMGLLIIAIYELGKTDTQ